MLFSKVILFLLFSGIPVILLILGSWQKCRIFHVSWVPVLIIFYKMLVPWRMRVLAKESFTIYFF